MTLQIDRRALLVTAGFGVGGLLMPAGAAAQALLGLTGFTHNVASGEPEPDSVLLWTRFVNPAGGTSRVAVEVADSEEFSRIITGGQMVTGPWRDHTVKITVDGLEPGKWYWYRFIGPDGSKSPIGRTKTLPVGKLTKFGIGVFSCSNIGYGEFNAYGHAAKRTDIDLMLHMGDYIYEYGRGGYDNPTFASRIFPSGEIYDLADYRLRYSAYRSDPQLQALHASFPMIANTDDHEGANDSWEGGAQNHTPDEGDWSPRRNAAMQVWREWLPVGELPWKAYAIGDLATYYRTDTRMVARSRPNFWGEIQRGDDIPKALADFKQGPWQELAATMLGSEQETWLYRSFARNKAVWTILGSGTNMGYNYTPEDAMNWLPAGAPERSKSYVRQGISAGKAGLPYNLDNWGGYPRARTRLLAAAQRAGANLVVVTGDSHNGWAFDLDEAGKPAGVEFGGHSVSSPGYESAAKGIDPLVIAKGLIGDRKGELKWMDASNRGYMKITLSPDLASNEWVFMETVASTSLATKTGHKMSVRKGRNMLDVA